MISADRTSRCAMRGIGIVLPGAVVLVWTGLAIATLPTVDPIIGAANGKVYHTHPDCSAIKMITAENRVTFATVEQAETEGRRLCKSCEKLHAKNADQKSKVKSIAGKPRTTQPAVTKQTIDDRTNVRVKSVLPGGTLLLDKGEKATLAGVSFPLERQEMAAEAVRRVEERVNGVMVTLIWNANQYGRDSLGRMKISIQPSEGRPDLGAELIADGLAWCDTSVDFPGRAEYLKKEKEAWEKGKGIWKRLDGAAGKREVLVGRYATHYHPVDCGHEAHLIDSSRVTLNEAKARRLTPCETYQMTDADGQDDATARQTPKNKSTHEEKE